MNDCAIYADRALDATLYLRGAARALDRLAAAIPTRTVLVLCVYREGSERADLLPVRLQSERHDVELAFGAMGVWTLIAAAAAFVGTVRLRRGPPGPEVAAVAVPPRWSSR